MHEGLKSLVSNVVDTYEEHRIGRYGKVEDHDGSILSTADMLGVPLVTVEWLIFNKDYEV